MGAETVGILEDRRLWALSDSELIDRLDDVFTGLQTLRAQWLELIAELDGRDLPAKLGANGTGAWLRDRMRIHPRTATRDLTLARGLQRLPVTSTALAAGKVNAEQAEAIQRSTADLPADLGQALHTKVEETLVGFAAEFGPPQLAQLGQRALELVAPQVAEEHTARQLERDEQRARRDSYFTLSPDGLGRTRLSGILTNAAAATVSAAIESLCSPAACRARQQNDGHGDGEVWAPGRQHGDGHGDGEVWTPGRRRAEALVLLGQIALDGGTLPQHGGGRPQVIVTMPFEPWRDATQAALDDTGMGRIGTGRLANGRLVTAATVRRMACDAGILPMVLGGDGQVLDVGRQHRPFSPAIRKALFVRDRGCAFPACDQPPERCDGHHVVAWAHGGATSLDNAVLVCRRHHGLVHDGDWTVRIAADRLPEFVPPTYIDPLQRPRRNQYHRRT